MAFLMEFLMGAINGILMGLYAVVYSDKQQHKPICSYCAFKDA